jgi:hypothetical protein
MSSETVMYKQETVAPAKTFVNRGASQTRLIAGVSVPDSPLITAVIEHAQQLSEPYLFNHAMRSWLFAEAIGRIKGIDSCLLPGLQHRAPAAAMPARDAGALSAACRHHHRKHLGPAPTTL